MLFLFQQGFQKYTRMTVISDLGDTTQAIRSFSSEGQLYKKENNRIFLLIPNWDELLKGVSNKSEATVS